MYITGKRIKEELGDIWPGSFNLCTDGDFLVPTVKQYMKVAKEAKKNLVDNLPVGFADKIFECEDITKAFIGEVIQIRVKEIVGKKKSQQFWRSWPNGICFGRSFFAQYGAHYQAIVRCQEGWRLFEPQTVAIWAPEPPDDDVLFTFI